MPNKIMSKKSKEIILVVDDTPTNLETMEIVLNRPEWEVVSVDSGTAALSCITDPHGCANARYEWL